MKIFKKHGPKEKFKPNKNHQVVVLLEKEELGMPPDWVERLAMVPVVEVLGLKSSCSGILAQYPVLQ
jgi:hypothetical protein